jgi:hypothetical protein
MAEIEILSIVSGVLGLLLVVSETIGWSACRYNSITEFFYDITTVLTGTKDPIREPATPPPTRSGSLNIIEVAEDKNRWIP